MGSVLGIGIDFGLNAGNYTVISNNTITVQNVTTGFGIRHNGTYYGVQILDCDISVSASAPTGIFQGTPLGSNIFSIYSVSVCFLTNSLIGNSTINILQLARSCPYSFPTVYGIYVVGVTNYQVCSCG